MRWIVLLAVLPGILWIYGDAPAKSKPQTRPNILLIMADDMGFSDIGCFGGEIHTPNLDKLSREGIRFTRFYNNAWCSPTRASLLTGLYPQQAGMAGLAWPKTGPPGPDQGYLNDRCVTLAEVLKEAGYYTAMAGKWHLGEHRPNWPTDRGFDNYFGLISGAVNYFDITQDKTPSTVRTMALDSQRYYPPKKGFYMTDAITGYADKILERQKTTVAPFFLYVAYTAPHWPLHALPEDIARYAGRYESGWDSLRLQRYRRLQQLGIISPATTLSPRDSGVTAWAQLPAKTRKEMAHKMAVYAAQVDRMDQGIGRMLDQLERSGKAGNTIVIFLSDNGGCAEGGPQGLDNRKNGITPGSVDSYMSYGQSWANASNTPFRHFKKNLLEGGISTPLIVRWPAGIQPQRYGQIIEQAGHVTDMMPTLCAAAGARYPTRYKGHSVLPMEGRNLLPVIETGKVQSHPPVFWSLNDEKAIITGKYKLTAAGKNAPWELYNLEKDRMENDNCAATFPLQVKDMQQQWETWAKRVGIR
ncbi:arylsulfatase [Chitinophaga sp. GCM10012297]|uniref:Arylsulfatase n=1 Tax=Chitinophaga chungangae TaxID=2821488 RepID=A0ABS3YFL4_9BACT|nr:arylsulfatase [Chitinophaga chungangae]MBO9153472.1 arylsulfatase [Chitinophaga chungangae]